MVKNLLADGVKPIAAGVTAALLVTVCSSSNSGGVIIGKREVPSSPASRSVTRQLEVRAPSGDTSWRTVNVTEYQRARAGEKWSK